jgi:molybdate transport system substrate-binding protein
MRVVLSRAAKLPLGENMTNKNTSGRGGILVGVMLALFSQTAFAAEISLLASVPLKDSYIELLPMFERESGHRITPVWVNGAEMEKRISAHEFADVMVLSSGGAQALASQGNLMSDTVAPVAKSGIGIAIRAGSPSPEIGSAESLKRTVNAAKSVAWSSTGASGPFVVAMFQSMGIINEVNAKRAAIKPGEPVGDLVARGDAEIGFTQVSEFLTVKGIQFLGPLPPEVQKFTIFFGGVYPGAKDAEAARAFVKFLASPSATPTLKKYGLEPG